MNWRVSFVLWLKLQLTFFIKCSVELDCLSVEFDLLSVEFDWLSVEINWLLVVFD